MHSLNIEMEIIVAYLPLPFNLCILSKIAALNGTPRNDCNLYMRQLELRTEVNKSCSPKRCLLCLPDPKALSSTQVVLNLRGPKVPL